ncbi:fibronectin type III domain protein [Aspergillus crustosus]
MRLFAFLAFLPLPLARGSPAPNPNKPAQEWSPNSTLPSGGTRITDPDRLSALYTMHQEVLTALNNNEAIPVDRSTNLTAHVAHDKRQFQVFGLLGMVLLSRLGLKALEEVLDALLGIFTNNDIIWESPDNCRARFETQGGGNEHYLTYAKGTRSPTADETRNVGWNDPANTDPPVHFFEGDPAIGLYSVQYTATDEYAWDGIPGTVKCNPEVLCNPQYIFYHKGYRIVLNTWQSQGRTSACQYSGGEDCLGLCSSGVLNEFLTGGVLWGGDCAIPCVDDVPDDAVVIPNEEASFMVVGDSISHGMEDDWTWRYRLSQWSMGLTEIVDHNGYTHHFPDAPLFPDEEPRETINVEGGYAKGVTSSFRNTGHASFWGRQASQSKGTINGWVKEYKPDYLLILLGFNDLGWWVSGPDALVGDIGSLVNEARKAKPDIKLLIGNVVHRTFLDGRQDLVDNTNRYNILLKERMSSWFRSESPIAYVDVNTDYDCRPNSCPDGYDGLHPNARGEYHIAQAFARVLQRDFGYAGIGLRVPEKVDGRSVGVPQNVRTTSWPEGLLTSWDPVENSRGYEIRNRVKGVDGWWSSGEVYPSTDGSWQPWVADGQTWEYQVRTKGDGNTRSDWSAFSSATANVATAPGPSNIIVEPQGTDIFIHWDEVTGYYVDRYGVYVWDKDTEGSWLSVTPAKTTSLTVKGLKAGHRYSIWVATYVGMIGSLTKQSVAAGGLPASARDAIAGYWAPTPPSNLRVQNLDATSVRLTWNKATGASGYRLFTRSVKDNTELKPGGTTTDTSYEVYMLFPGTWNYEFCIAAYNGNLETAPISCVIPPICCGFEKRDLVPGNDNYTVVENMSTIYDETEWIEDEDLKDLFAVYQQTEEYAAVVGAGQVLSVPEII